MSHLTRCVNFGLFLVLSLAFDPLRCAVPRAEAATMEHPSWIMITEGKTAQGFPYLFGGVGSDEREIMQKQGNAYNVRLSFSAKGGAFLADVKLVIADAKGAELLSVIVPGPLFFIQLPAGSYTVSATYGDRTRQIKSLAVVKDKTVRRTLIWDLGEQSPNV